MLTTYYLTILMYVLPTQLQVSDANNVVVEISPGFRGVVVADNTPGAVAIIPPGIIGESGPDEGKCKKWGDEVRQTMAKDKKLKDYRQLKYRCDLRPVVY